MASSTRAQLQPSLGGGSLSNLRTALLLVALAVVQVVVGGIGLVDGRTLLTLFTDPSGRSVPPSSQFLVDSPLPIAIGHVLGVRSIVGVAALSIFFAAAPLLVFTVLRLTQKLTTPQALSVASVFCALPTWKVLAQYLGKPDGLVILLVGFATLTRRNSVALVAAVLLVVVHIQMGLAIGLMLVCLEWQNPGRRWATASGCAAGYAAARLLQAAMGVDSHQGRVDYALTFWQAGGGGLSACLPVAIVGAVGGGWFFVGDKWKSATHGDRVRLTGTLVLAAALAIVGFDNSRDMYLLCLPAVLWSAREGIWGERIHPLRTGIVALALLLLPLPDVAAGKIRRHAIDFLPSPTAISHPLLQGHL